MVFVRSRGYLYEAVSLGVGSDGLRPVIFILKPGVTRFKQPSAPRCCSEQSLRISVLGRQKNIRGSTRFNDLTF